MKKLDYCDLLNAIETLKDRMQAEEIEYQINQLVLTTFEAELKKLKPPNNKPEEEQKDQPETNHLG